MEVLAAGTNTTASDGAPSLDGFLKEEGITDNIPIFVPTTNFTPTGQRDYQATMKTRVAGYIDAARIYEDAVTVYRRVLSQATAPIDILAVGFLNNLRELLLSTADGVSSLSGAQLVAQKCRRLWVMGGRYPSGTENNFAVNATARTAAAYVCGNWPSEIYFCGFEVGNTVFTGGGLQGMQATDVLAQALLDASVSGGRQSWDPMTTMACIAHEPERAGYTLVRGSNSVDTTTGANTWSEDVNGKDAYLVKSQPDAWFSSQLNALLLFSNWSWYTPYIAAS